MIYEVDQSVKIEQTNAGTVLSICNDESLTLLIPAAVKRECLDLLRRQGQQSKIIGLRVFAAALFLLLERYLSRAERIVIDVEYTGHETSIREMLLNLIWQRHPDFDPHTIVFARVGKRSRAHNIAIAVVRQKASADLVLTTRRLLGLLRYMKVTGGPTHVYPEP